MVSRSREPSGRVGRNGSWRGGARVGLVLRRLWARGELTMTHVSIGVEGNWPAEEVKAKHGISKPLRSPCRRNLLDSLHQIQIHIIRSQPLQTQIQTFFRFPMKRRPELGTQEQFFPVNPRVFDPLTDFFFVLVHEGSVDMSVAGFNG